MNHVDAVVLFFGGCFVLFAWTVTEHLLAMRRINQQIKVGEKGPCTFVVQDTEVMLLAVTGTYHSVGQYQLVVTDAQGLPTVVDRRDIVEVIN